MPKIETSFTVLAAYRTGRSTVVTVEGPKAIVGVGVSVRHPSDAEDQALGVEVAYVRALRDVADQVQKQLDGHFERMVRDQELRATRKRQAQVRQRVFEERRKKGVAAAAARAAGEAAAEERAKYPALEARNATLKALGYGIMDDGTFGKFPSPCDDYKCATCNSIYKDSLILKSRAPEDDDS